MNNTADKKSVYKIVTNQAVGFINALFIIENFSVIRCYSYYYITFLALLICGFMFFKYYKNVVEIGFDDFDILAACKSKILQSEIGHGLVCTQLYTKAVIFA